MTLPRPYILFDKPLKVNLPDLDIYLITGLWKYYDSVLIIHSYGYTDLKFLPVDTVGEIERRLKEIINHEQTK